MHVGVPTRPCASPGRHESLGSWDRFCKKSMVVMSTGCLNTLLYFHRGMELSEKLLGGVKDLILPGILLGMLDHQEE